MVAGLQARQDGAVRGGAADWAALPSLTMLVAVARPWLLTTSPRLQFWLTRGPPYLSVYTQYLVVRWLARQDPAQPGLLARLCCARPTQALATISLSLYLVHIPTWHLLAKLGTPLSTRQKAGNSSFFLSPAVGGMCSCDVMQVTGCCPGPGSRSSPHSPWWASTSPPPSWWPPRSPSWWRLRPGGSCGPPSLPHQTLIFRQNWQPLNSEPDNAGTAEL